MNLHRMIDLPPKFNMLHLAALLMGILFLHGCATVQQSLLKLQPTYHLESEIERNHFIVEKRESIIGRLAVIRIQKGDTLPDIARHFSLGINSVSSANPGVDVWVPEAGERVLLPLSFILPDTRRKGIVINLAAMRLFYYKKDGDQLTVSTYPVGVGTPERPTPMGQMYIRRKKFRPTWYVPASIAEDHRKKGDPLPPKIPPGPLNPLGEHALYLSKPSYLIHGTNKPASIGLMTTNGCIRLYPEDIEQLFESTPLKTPVRIVNQPLLVGLRNGVVYMEAHAPPTASGNAELEKAYEKLKKIETGSGHAFDWDTIKKIVSEARGIPVPISEIHQASPAGIAEPIRLNHPDQLYGKPTVAELRTDA
ncbi:MAG: L,D-transpeptidase family protein, partial [Desulfobacterales bacterium]